MRENSLCQNDSGFLSQRRFKLAILSPNLAGGGAERIAVNLGNGMAARRHDVEMVLGEAEGPYLSELSPGIRLVVLHSERALAAVPSLARYLLRTRPDALITTHLYYAVVALTAGRLAHTGTRILPSIQTTPSASLGGGTGVNRLERMALRICCPWADALVACSQGVADDFSQAIGLPRQRIRVIYNPALDDRIESLSKEPVDHAWFAAGGPKVVLSVGRLSPPKDFSAVLRAFGLVRQNEDARLVILGEGEDRGRIEQLVRDLGLNESVSLPGFVKNPFAYMARAAVFVFSSLWEGLPTVIVEALALGVPVVATDCRSGPREILRDGRYGRLVPVGHVEAMADAIRAALAGPNPQIPAEALQPYTFDGAIDKYESLIAELMKE